MMATAPFKRLKIFPFLSLAALLSCASHSSPDSVRNAASVASANVVLTELSSSQIVDGSVVLITIHVPRETPANAEVVGQFEDQRFYFYPLSEEGVGVYQAVVGVPHNHKPGPADISVSVAGTVKSLPVQITDARYPSEVLKVDSRHVNPNKRDLIRIRKDIAEVGKIYSTVLREKLWKGPFVLPIDSSVTSVFGTKRVFNGQMRSYHSGLDLKAPIGTPIHAAAPGVVVLAKNLFFTGNTVLINHGYGVITLYAHMSRLKVRKGQRVKAKQLVGLSGMTGRANGPHLHWGVIINKVKVNPLEALKVIR